MSVHDEHNTLERIARFLELQEMRTKLPPGSCGVAAERTLLVCTRHAGHSGSHGAMHYFGSAYNMHGNYVEF